MITDMQEKMVVQYLKGSACCHDEKAAKAIFDALVSIPLNDFPALLIKHAALCEVTTGSIPQFSDPTVSFYRIPKILAEKAPSTISYVELGAMIYPSKGLGAQGKYGENHGKLAVALDLASCVKSNGHWVFGTTAMGRFFCKLKQDEKDQLLQRLCYRIPIIQHMVVSADATTEMEVCLSILSESTRNRRRSNVLDLYDFAIDA